MPCKAFIRLQTDMVVLVNVDEIFVDLCRQLLRRDDLQEEARDELMYQKEEDAAAKKRRRRKRKDRCMII